MMGGGMMGGGMMGGGGRENPTSASVGATSTSPEGHADPGCMTMETLLGM
jgi:hypothetical protein